MVPRKAKKSSTPTPQEPQEVQSLQEMYDLPDEIKQRDLEEILEAQTRLRAAREELDSLCAHLETALAVGLHVEPGKFGIATDGKGHKQIVEYTYRIKADTPF